MRSGTDGFTVEDQVLEKGEKGDDTNDFRERKGGSNHFNRLERGAKIVERDKRDDASVSGTDRA